MPRPLNILFWHGVVGASQTANLVDWVQEAEYLGLGLQVFYLALTVVFAIVYICISGPFVYRAEFHENDDQAKVSMMKALGILWLCVDTPVMFTEISIAREHGFHAVIQGVSLVLHVLSWIGGFFLLYLLVLAKAAEVLHRRTGCDDEIMTALATTHKYD